jgi:hypothetical protein
MDSRVGEGQGGAAASYCINYRVVCTVIVRVNSNENVTVSRASLTQ